MANFDAKLQRIFDRDSLLRSIQLVDRGRTRAVQRLWEDPPIWRNDAVGTAADSWRHGRGDVQNCQCKSCPRSEKARNDVAPNVSNGGECHRCSDPDRCECVGLHAPWSDGLGIHLVLYGLHAVLHWVCAVLDWVCSLYHRLCRLLRVGWLLPTMRHLGVRVFALWVFSLW